MQVNVKGGTGAGRRTVKQRGSDWKCPTCNRKLRYYWTRCPQDGTQRPD